MSWKCCGGGVMDASWTCRGCVDRAGGGHAPARAAYRARSRCLEKETRGRSARAEEAARYGKARGRCRQRGASAAGRRSSPQGDSSGGGCGSWSDRRGRRRPREAGTPAAEHGVHGHVGPQVWRERRQETEERDGDGRLDAGHERVGGEHDANARRRARDLLRPRRHRDDLGCQPAPPPALPLPSSSTC